MVFVEARQIDCSGMRWQLDMDMDLPVSEMFGVGSCFPTNVMDRPVLSFSGQSIGVRSLKQVQHATML